MPVLQAVDLAGQRRREPDGVLHQDDRELHVGLAACARITSSAVAFPGSLTMCRMRGTAV